MIQTSASQKSLKLFFCKQAKMALNQVNVLEHCRVSPPSNTVAELSLPLTLYDVGWTVFSPIQRLHFYEFPHPKAFFVETIIPKLKESLSLTLKHYAPLAGNLVFPFDSGMPELRYMAGDSVSVTFAESSEDFNYLVGDHARNSHRFYPLLPQLPPPSVASSIEITPVLAVQVTVFPNAGISIGCTSLHAVGDASAIVNFTRTWASTNKFNGDAHLASSSLPFFDRAVIQDPFQLGAVICNLLKDFKSQQSSQAAVKQLAANQVRATYDICQTDIQKLKSLVMAKRPNLVHVSTFTVVCAFVWTCWLKSKDAIGEKVDNNKPEFFFAFVDCRSRLDPPIPANYFGNCIVPCILSKTHGELVGNEGLFVAAELIGEGIRRRAHDREGILQGVWLTEGKSIAGIPGVLAVAGSPKYDTYDADFGWGKPAKYESVSTDSNEAMSLNKSRRFEGGLEIGLSLRKNRMDAFTSVFSNDLKIL